MTGIIFYAPCSECGIMIPVNEYHFCVGMIATTGSGTHTIPFRGEYPDITGEKIL